VTRRWILIFQPRKSSADGAPNRCSECQHFSLTSLASEGVRLISHCYPAAALLPVAVLCPAAGHTWIFSDCQTSRLEGLKFLHVLDNHVDKQRQGYHVTWTPPPMARLGWKIDTCTGECGLSTRVVCTVHPCQRALLVKSIALQWFCQHGPCTRVLHGTHYPCSPPVNTGVVLDTREHGPSRRAVIVNDVIIFYLKNAWDSTDYNCSPWTRVSKMTPVFTGRITRRPLFP